MKKFNLIIFFLENVMSSMVSAIDENRMIETLAKEVYPNLPISDAIQLIKEDLKQIKYFKRNDQLYKVVCENNNIFILNVDSHLAEEIPESSIHIFNKENENKY